MKKVTNRRTRRTTIPLPGRGIVLNKRGDSSLISNEEAKEPIIKTLQTRKTILVEEAADHEGTPEQPDQRELARIRSVKAAQARINAHKNRRQ